MSLQIGERLDVEIIDIAHRGYGVAKNDGQVIFVSGSLLGEKLEVEIVDVQSRLAFAKTTKVIRPSNHRVENIWSLARSSGVGGADLGHIDLEGQRLWKSQVLANHFRHVANLEVNVEVKEIPGDDIHGLHWRTRVKFVLDEVGGLAMYAPNSKILLPVDDFPLAFGSLKDIWPSFLIADDKPHSDGKNKNVSALENNYISAKGSGDIDFKKFVGRSVSLVWPSASEPIAVLENFSNPNIRVQEKVKFKTETYFYKVLATGFWQIHRLAPDLLVARLLELSGNIRQANVLELYAGAGLFSLPLSRAISASGGGNAGGRLITVESSKTAVTDARINLRETSKTYIKCARTDKALDDMKAALKDTDLVVLDPPRGGAGIKTVEKIADLKASKIIYIACDPVALARDANALCTNGYRLEHMEAWDLYPHTHHFESIAVFQR